MDAEDMEDTAATVVPETVVEVLRAQRARPRPEPGTHQSLLE
jgi:hypothetical protein